MAKEKRFEITATEDNYVISCNGFSDIELIGILTLQLEYLKVNKITKRIIKELKDEETKGETN